MNTLQQFFNSLNGNVELCTDYVNDYDVDVGRVLDGLQLLQ